MVKIFIRPTEDEIWINLFRSPEFPYLKINGIRMIWIAINIGALRNSIEAALLPGPLFNQEIRRSVLSNLYVSIL